MFSVFQQEPGSAVSAETSLDPVRFENVSTAPFGCGKLVSDQFPFHDQELTHL
jgi:hypothetical protein